MRNPWLYILAMFVVTYLIRVLPLTLFRKKITNKTVRSFLYYVPFITLAVMTFPDIIHATQFPIAGAVALLVGVVLAFLGGGLVPVAISCCAVVFIVEWIITLL